MFVETKTKTDSTIAFQNWNLIHHPGNVINTNIRGGSLLQMHPYFKLTKSNAPAINNPLNDCIHISIPFQDEQLHFFLVYNHPTSIVEESIFRMATIHKYSIIIGDLNINTNQKKRHLSQFLTNADFKVYQTDPTFIMPNNDNDTTPDMIIYSSNLTNIFNKVELVPDLGSDHLAIHLQLKLTATIDIEDIPTKYRYHKCNIERVNTEMKKYLENLGEINERHITNFNNTLAKIILANTPKFKRQYYNYELPPFIIRVIKLKRKMYREYKMERNTEIKKMINQLGKNIHYMIQKYNEYKWLQTCKDIEDSQGKKFYEKINKVTKYRQKSAIDILTEGNKQYSTDQEKAKIFANHFQKALSPDSNQLSDQNTENTVNNWFNKYFNKKLKNPNIEIDEGEYHELLSKQKNTSPGHDNIPWNIFKQLDINIHQHIIRIYEYCINNSYIPQIWKTGNIITIHKPNSDPKKASNYRPITLLPIMGKLLEKIIKKLLLNFTTNLIPKYQYGFREKHSTTHPLIVLTSNIEAKRLDHQHTAAIFLDINKAFDSVWHRGLLYKLAKMHIPDYLLHIIRIYLEQRSMKIKVNNTYSESFTPLQGVPQGSPLAPLLYNLYCYDIYQQINPDKYLLQYADDTALISHNTNIGKATEGLQQLINHLEVWFHRWKMKQNPQKSQFIIFYHTPKPNSPTVKIGNTDIKPNNTIKYLGINIDNKLNFKNHININKKRIKTRAKYFRSLTHKADGISPTTAGKIYKSICRPIIEYAHPILMNCRKGVMKTLQTSETAALRYLTKMRHPENPLHNPPNTLLYSRTKTTPILHRIETLRKKFAENPSNLEILMQMCIDRAFDTSRYRHPNKTIYQRIQSLTEQ